VSRALLLAHARNAPAILLSQPLAAIEFLYRHVSQGMDLPKDLAVIVGGYPLPASGEQFLSELCQSSCTQCCIFHAYGDAEVDYAVLVGRRSGHEQVMYQIVHPEVEVQITEGQLHLRKRRSDGSMSTKSTGDAAKRVAGGIEITNGPQRVSPVIMSGFTKWDAHYWIRRTGYAVMTAAGPAFQLRTGVVPCVSEEVEHFAFCRLYGASWGRKPSWGVVVGL